ncbi:hypothetical protein HRR83_006430 [Exophiala dermatitidis]|uniref:Vacuolar membrane protein n=2 Tax=Exophiala dermatitidis TaxID=5970 RepID=H6CAA7_EXODN|nr:uncharacterized protein HMPREF1120_08043 [Exophiala dermatitidis NIH/UT8656]KAJ4504531.1 hypothetical protein HRR73_008705 [Exophiala dermatitidis]EHY60071.1 hypothetical protein HMPREF1120_08043 [Exophiala dermatitidis NIH/UT8656]KAJ4505383.1 hypothetical protein HRR74_008754 [Exophiala dermatitidis]KAJ4530628.1 hypothetical protein HRR76_008329 [Exophiala dermatitidis]KAJ4545204.1 hypothetical protein HRR77_005060 [Exophiala dermatitidis]
MHPPEYLPSAASVDDAIVSPSHTLASSIMAVTTTSLVFSIATAPSTVLQTSYLPLMSPSSSSVASAALSNKENTGECKLLGPFAILVQGALGALALSSLVYKRWRERPQRPLKVWWFDVSKQVVGSILLHLANLVMSLFSSGQIEPYLAKTDALATTLGAATTTEAYQPNPCSFYLLNLAIDTTLGIPILIGILKVLTIVASYTYLANPPESIMSGHYGTPPKATWWLKQCLIYFLGLLGMKTCVFIIFQLCPWLERVGDWALRWTEGNEAIQIAFVMLIFPLIMNALQYYIIDTFIKEKSPRDEHDHEEGHDDREEHHGLLAEENADHGATIEEDEVCKGDVVAGSKSKFPLASVSFDADKDDDVEPPPQGEASSLADHAEEEAVEHRPRV